MKLCGVGFCELYLKGRRVGDQLLDPVVTQYDRCVHFYVEYDVTDSLVSGDNVIRVILGNTAPRKRFHRESVKRFSQIKILSNLCV